VRPRCGDNMDQPTDPAGIPEVVPVRPRRARREPEDEDDQLQGYWKAIIWGSLLLPCVGGWIIVVLSSVMYYVWLRDYPNKARSINRHGWMAWVTGQGIAVLIWWFLYQLQQPV